MTDNTLKIWLTVAALMALSVTSRAGTLPVYDSAVKHAFMNGQMEVWEQTIGDMEKEHAATGDEELLFHLTAAAYGFTGYLMGNDREEAAEAMLEKTIHHCEALKATRYKPQAYAIEAGTYGYRIGLSPFKAPVYGRKNQKALKQSMELDDENPMVWMEKGNAYYHMPRLFGGSYKKAVRFYSTALELYEEKAGEYPAWLRLNTLVWLGKAYEEMGDEELARRTYRKALALEPQFRWVKDDLLPGLDR